MSLQVLEAGSLWSSKALIAVEIGIRCVCEGAKSIGGRSMTTKVVSGLRSVGWLLSRVRSERNAAAVLVG